MKSEGLEFTKADVPVIRGAVEMLGKATEAASAALEKLKLDPMHVNAIATRNEAIADCLAKNVGRDEFTMATALGATLRLGLKLEREQVDKIVKAQLSLQIEVNDNEQRLEGIKRCDAIASGQMSLV